MVTVCPSVCPGMNLMPQFSGCQLLGITRFANPRRWIISLPGLGLRQVVAWSSNFSESLYIVWHTGVEEPRPRGNIRGPPSLHDFRPPCESMYTKTLRVYAALAWLHGCVRSEVPKDLLVDCSNDEYRDCLQKRWSRLPSRYWSDAFQSHKKHRVFEYVDSTSVSDAGCLLVHSQKTSFALDWRGNTYCDIIEKPKIGCNPIIIRSEDHGIAGTIFLDDYAVQKL
jgi:hypothetical protein